MTALLLVSLLAGCGEDTSANEAATWGYWSTLHAIAQRSEPLSLGSATTPEELITAANNGSTLARQLAREIRDLPVAHVDPELAEYGSEFVWMLNEGASVYSEFGRLLKDYLTHQQQANSPEMLVESFIRGFLGDPLGKANEINAATQQLEQRRQQLLARWSQSEQRINELATVGIKLRATLSTRYNREFPSLN